MDILIPILLLLALYVVPELLKRRKPTEYKYPDIPAKTPPANDIPPKSKPTTTIIDKVPSVDDVFIEPWPKTTQTWMSPTAAPVKKPISNPQVVNAPLPADEGSPWQNQLSQRMVINGIIFAEIIQPPRAHRPIWQRRK